MNLKDKKKLVDIFSRIMVVACVLFAPSIQAQVTIGAALAPNRGALLDLKEWEQADDGANSTRGLILPRVKLTKIDELIDIPQANGPANAGLMIYNVNNDICAGPIAGIYVWNGSIWVGIGVQDKAPGVYEVVDPRDGEIYLARNFGNIAGDWMLENIRYVPKVEDGYIDYVHHATEAALPYYAKHYAYPEGLERPYIPNNHPSEKWESNKKNGLLYNWAAATNGENTSIVNQSQSPGGGDPVTTPIRGICPPDWHVPSDKEYNDLEREIYNNAHLYSTYSESDKDSWQEWQSAWEYLIDLRPIKTVAAAHGAAMRSPCLPGNGASKAGGKSLTSKQGGFNLLLTGQGYGGAIAAYESRSTLWTSSSSNNLNAKNRYMRTDSHGVYLSISGRGYLHSVRCKK